MPSHRSEAELLVLAHLQNVHEQGNPRGDYPADPASLTRILRLAGRMLRQPDLLRPALRDGPATFLLAARVEVLTVRVLRGVVVYEAERIRLRQLVRALLLSPTDTQGSRTER